MRSRQSSRSSIYNLGEKATMLTWEETKGRRLKPVKLPREACRRIKASWQGGNESGPRLCWGDCSWGARGSTRWRRERLLSRCNDVTVVTIQPVIFALTLLAFLSLETATNQYNIYMDSMKHNGNIAFWAWSFALCHRFDFCFVPNV